MTPSLFSKFCIAISLLLLSLITTVACAPSAVEIASLTATADAVTVAAIPPTPLPQATDTPIPTSTQTPTQEPTSTPTITPTPTPTATPTLVPTPIGGSSYTLAFIGNDNKVYMGNFDEGFTPVTEFEGTLGPFFYYTPLAISADNKKLLFASGVDEEHWITHVDLETNESIELILIPRGASVASIDWMPQNNQIAAYEVNRESGGFLLSELWLLFPDTEQRHYIGDNIHWKRWGEDGLLYYYDGGQTINTFDPITLTQDSFRPPRWTPGGDEIEPFFYDDTQVAMSVFYCTDYFPDTKTYVCEGWGESYSGLFVLRTGENIAREIIRDEHVSQYLQMRSISPDGKHMFVGGMHGGHLIDLESFEKVALHTELSWILDWSPDGKSLATIIWEQTGDQWGKVFAIFEAHTGKRLVEQHFPDQYVGKETNGAVDGATFEMLWAESLE